jgi:hypothetical protein
VSLPPFGDVTIPFAEDDGMPRALTVLFGGAGVGKTSVLGAIAATRPGHATALVPGAAASADGSSAFAVAEWSLGMDDTERPHPLTLATPTAKVERDEHAEMLRRREQAHFDRVAKDGGFVMLVLPSARWFSRAPFALSAPARTIARYDVRSPLSTSTGMDDHTRADLARDTKQALAYAAITAALSADRVTGTLAHFGRTMARTVDALVALAGFSYAGIDPLSLEPLFKSAEGRLLGFDALPTCARHLVAFGALPVRALWAAYPSREPADAEGVVCIDEIELQQDAQVQGSVLGVLRSVLPRVQWIVTTTSPLVAASVEDREVHALRKLPRAAEVQLFSGPHARVH